MKLTSDMPEDERKRYRIVRRDTMADVPGLIVRADEDAGLCLMRDKTGASTEYNFGPGGLRIVSAR